MGAPIADWIGRKYSIVFWCLVFCVGMIAQVAATDKWYQVMMGRFVAGFGVGALSLLVPMYQAETGPRHIRGALISTYQLMITFGIFLAAVLNYAAERHQSGHKASWQITMGLSFVFAAILGLGIRLFPETPRYDYRKGRPDKAKRTMTKIYGVSDNNWAVHVELEEIKAKLETESRRRNAIQEWLNMWRAPKNGISTGHRHGPANVPAADRVREVRCVSAALTPVRANYFFYYGTVIFKGTGINNSFVTQMILNGINFGVTFYGLYIVEHYGRRKSLMAG